MTPLLARLLRGGSVLALVSAAIAAASCSKDDAEGQLTIAIQTDLAMPKDLDYIRIEVRTDGLPLGTDAPPPLHRNDYPINPSDPPDVRVTIPATFAVYNHKGSVEPVAVRVSAGRGGQPRVLRDALTSVPTDRNAMLRLYLQWLSDGSAKAPPPGGDPRAAINACPELQTNVAGTCVDAHVALSSLPDFDATKLFGGPSPAAGVGFDVLSCFAATQPVTPDAQCSFVLPPPVAPEKVNVGLELPAGSDGICSATHCIVPLDRQEVPVGPAVGWFVVANRVQLPPGVCTRALAVPAMRIVLSTQCPSKTPATPSCGPPSAATDCSIHGAEDGGAPPPPTFTAGGSLTLGRDHTCTLVEQTISCWGQNALLQTGMAGGGTVLQSAPASRLAPSSSPTTTALAVSAGVDGTCAAVSDGVYCWGGNRYGERGASPIPMDDDAKTTAIRVGIFTPTAATKIAVSSAGLKPMSHACASGGGQTVCWGANGSMQTGAAGPDGVGQPLMLDASVLALGEGFTCTLDALGQTECWGDNTTGQLGRPVSAAQPRDGMPVANVPRSKELVAGADFACALANDATVWCWGNGQSAARVTKTPGAVLPNPAGLASLAKSIAAGSDFVCATLLGTTTSPETVHCWGSNTVGQLGATPSATTTENQVVLPVAPPYDKIVAGGRRACVISGHTVACWGANDYGQIMGQPSATPLSPTVVPYSGL